MSKNKIKSLRKKKKTEWDNMGLIYSHARNISIRNGRSANGPEDCATSEVINLSFQNHLLYSEK